jgi:hypothetical protein
VSDAFFTTEVQRHRDTEELTWVLLEISGYPGDKLVDGRRFETELRRSLCLGVSVVK